MDLQFRTSLVKASAFLLLLAVFLSSRSIRDGDCDVPPNGDSGPAGLPQISREEHRGDSHRAGPASPSREGPPTFPHDSCRDKRSLGEAQFGETLASIRAYDAEKNIRLTLKIESVLYVMLNKNGVNLPHMLDKDLAQRQREKPFWPTRSLRTN